MLNKVLDHVLDYVLDYVLDHVLMLLVIQFTGAPIARASWSTSKAHSCSWM